MLWTKIGQSELSLEDLGRLQVAVLNRVPGKVSFEQTLEGGEGAAI